MIVDIRLSEESDARERPMFMTINAMTLSSDDAFQVASNLRRLLSEMPTGCLASDIKVTCFDQFGNTLTENVMTLDEFRVTGYNKVVADSYDDTHYMNDDIAPCDQPGYTVSDDERSNGPRSF